MGWRMSRTHSSSFRRFTYVTAHSPTLPSLYLRLQPFRCFIYVTAHSPTLPSLYLRLQPFRCFIYVTAHSPTHLSLLLRHRIFTYVTWRAAHEMEVKIKQLFHQLNKFSQTSNVAKSLVRITNR